MKSLFEYDFLVNETFYKCQHILDYIKNNPNMSRLDFMAIQATIMDALVYKNLIDPSKQSLDLKNLTIVDNLNFYQYEKYPDVCGIFQFMKEEFRKKSLYITGSIPISISLAKPPSKITRFCVYDPNTAVSSVFSDAIFYDVFYISPTRGKKIEEKRPFVEVHVDEESYLGDVLTKRVFKSSFFREKFGFEVVRKQKISDFSKEELEIYLSCIQEQCNLRFFIAMILPILDMNIPDFAEMKYELEKSKEYFPQEWDEFENLINSDKDDAQFWKRKN